MIRQLSIFSLKFWMVVMASCSVYDTKSTVQVYTYPPPKISEFSIQDNGVEFNITTDMNYLNHEDFNYFVLLLGSSGTDFQAAISSADMGSFTLVSQIPNYLAVTTKPSASGNYLNPLGVTIGLTNFTCANCDIAAIAYGFNETYGKLYDNNGWLYSKVSPSYSFHIPNFTEGTITEGQALAIDGREWKVSDDPALIPNSLSFIFATNIHGKQVHVMKVQGDVGYTSLGYVSKVLVTLPEDGYIDKSVVDHYFVVLPNHSYALKNLSTTTYARLNIKSADTEANSISFQLIYSTQSGERNF